MDGCLCLLAPDVLPCRAQRRKEARETGGAVTLAPDSPPADPFPPPLPLSSPPAAVRSVVPGAYSCSATFYSWGRPGIPSPHTLPSLPAISHPSPPCCAQCRSRSVLLLSYILCLGAICGSVSLLLLEKGKEQGGDLWMGAVR